MISTDTLPNKHVQTVTSMTSLKAVQVPDHRHAFSQTLTKKQLKAENEKAKQPPKEDASTLSSQLQITYDNHNPTQMVCTQMLLHLKGI